MNARHHFRAAETALAESREYAAAQDESSPGAMRLLAEAQVHASLAQTALEASRLIVAGRLGANGGLGGNDCEAWTDILTGGAE